MSRRIIIFGATGYTGRLLAERLAAQDAAPVLAGRSETALRELAEPLGLEWRTADALRQNSVFALLEPGDVLVSTVGPFVKWGEPAVRAAIAAKGVYIDSTGEPPFIRRVFEELGPPAAGGPSSSTTRRMNAGSPVESMYVAGAAIAARTAGSPQRANGPTVVTSTSPCSTRAKTELRRSASACRHSTPSFSASPRTDSGERPASTGSAPLAASRSATSRPV